MAKHCFMYEFSAEKKKGKKKVFALTIIFILPDGEFVQRWIGIMRRVKKRGYFFCFLKLSFRNAQIESRPGTTSLAGSVPANEGENRRGRRRGGPV